MFTLFLILTTAFSFKHHPHILNILDLANNTIKNPITEDIPLDGLDSLTDIVTSSPTLPPSSSPTSSPTYFPTSSPISPPTSSPTLFSTSFPTSSPASEARDGFLCESHRSIVERLKDAEMLNSGTSMDNLRGYGIEPIDEDASPTGAILSGIGAYIVKGADFATQSGGSFVYANDDSNFASSTVASAVVYSLLALFMPMHEDDSVKSTEFESEWDEVEIRVHTILQSEIARQTAITRACISDAVSQVDIVSQKSDYQLYIASPSFEEELLKNYVYKSVHDYIHEVWTATFHAGGANTTQILAANFEKGAVKCYEARFIASQMGREKLFWTMMAPNVFTYMEVCRTHFTSYLAICSTQNEFDCEGDSNLLNAQEAVAKMVQSLGGFKGWFDEAQNIGMFAAYPYRMLGAKYLSFVHNSYYSAVNMQKLAADSQAWLPMPQHGSEQCRRRVCRRISSNGNLAHDQVEESTNYGCPWYGLNWYQWYSQNSLVVNRCSKSFTDCYENGNRASVCDGRECPYNMLDSWRRCDGTYFESW